MKENVLKSFIRDTYQTKSIVPYIITGQVALFILLHIFDLVNYSGASSIDLYTTIVEKSVLPSHFRQFLLQPWSYFSHPFIYTNLWSLLFDSLWLYWMSLLFLNFLNTRQFNTVFLGGLALGGILIIAISLLPYFSSGTASWSSITFGISAITSTLLVLTPNTQVRLLLLGSIKFKWVAIVYLGLQFIYLVRYNPSTALVYGLIVFMGAMFTVQLLKGNDWSIFFTRTKRRNLKVLKNNTKEYKIHNAYPNQQEVDQILDKISLTGYESLTSKEKEILFRASKKQD